MAAAIRAAWAYKPEVSTMRYLILNQLRHTFAHFDAPPGLSLLEAWRWLCAQPTKTQACARVCFALGSTPFGEPRPLRKPGRKPMSLEQKKEHRRDRVRANRLRKRQVKQYGTIKSHNNTVWLSRHDAD
jgi:hypothetical protein